jgi:paraquat-inducible protein A
MGCAECDLLVDVPLRLGARQRCSCPRCGHVLSSGNLDRARQAFPFVISAAVLLPLSLLFPFMSFARSGIENEMNLFQTSWALYQDGSVVLSGIVFGFIVLVPSFVILATLVISLSLTLERDLPGLRMAARFVYTANSWSMVEVFIIGVLISLVKISHMAHVALGVSLWTYLAFAIMLVLALVRLDKVVVWEYIDGLRR